jgi:hypothetical protein
MLKEPAIIRKLFFSSILITFFLSICSCNNIKEKKIVLVLGENAYSYFNNDFNFELKIPDGWCVLDNDSYPDYFHKLTERINLKGGYQIVCSLIEKKHLYVFSEESLFNQPLYPIISIMRRYASSSLAIDNPDATARTLYNNLRQGYVYLEKINPYKMRFTTDTFKNSSDETIVKTIISGKNNHNSEHGLMIVYEYLHISSNRKAINDFLVNGGCLTGQANEYVPIFDAIVKNLKSQD